MSRAKMLDVGDVYDLSKHFKLQAKFTCIYIALYSVSVDAPPAKTKNSINYDCVQINRNWSHLEVSALVCLFKCSLMAVYLRESHEFVDVLGQEDHVTIWCYYGDEALQRLQVQAVHLSVVLAVAAAAAWRERQQTGDAYKLFLIQCWL